MCPSRIFRHSAGKGLFLRKALPRQRLLLCHRISLISFQNRRSGRQLEEPFCLTPFVFGGLALGQVIVTEVLIVERGGATAISADANMTTELIHAMALPHFVRECFILNDLQD
ncbi:MAG TPA: hypothetical protein VHB45_00375 [Alloacidobacterium sp.]|nr:hypothetical protein [Alloacidobacterium sp.]